MCGRFALRTPLNVLAETFFFEMPADISQSPRYNIAPTQPILAVIQTAEGERRQAISARWGLIPSWAKDPAIGNRMINARSETAHEKPSFRAAFRRRRCLLLADGYYEWQKLADGKQPWLFHRGDDQPFAMAGLWEQWKPADQSELICSATILTTSPNTLSAPIHDRMPVILDESAQQSWLDLANEDLDQLSSLLKPCEQGLLVADPVSSHVNNPRHEDAQCVRIAGERRDDGEHELF
jgi:putative SOS response-associated peptidase YedK